MGRTALYEAASVILTRTVRMSALKSRPHMPLGWLTPLEYAAATVALAAE